MKVVVMAPIAFVIGLAGATFAMKKSPAVPPAAITADSTHTAGDSTAKLPSAAGTKVDSQAAPHDSVSIPAGDSASAPAAKQPGSHPIPLPVATKATPPPTTPASAPAASPAGPDYPRLAGILGKLTASEAAPLLEHFSDAEVEGVLRRMDVTRVAGLLAALPKERSAVLGKRLLLGGTPK
ncbi:MAG: hypothetical protein V4558_07665 [Gemmatimonadota bacterium]